MRHGWLLRNLTAKVNLSFAVLLYCFLFACASQNPNAYQQKPSPTPSSVVTSNNSDQSSTEDNTPDSTSDTENQDKEKKAEEKKEITPTPEPSRIYKYQQIQKEIQKSEPEKIPEIVIPFSPIARKVYDKVTSLSDQGSTINVKSLASTGNKLIKTYFEGEEIFNGIKEMVSAAKYEVNLVTYNWEPDSDAARVIGEGLKLAEENITDKKKLTVRIIVDDFKFDSKKVIEVLNNSRKKWGLDANKINLQLAVYPHYTFGSLHSKYIIVDSRHLIVTSANVVSKHDFNDNKWHDIGYLFQGAIASMALTDFDQAWENYAKHYDCENKTIFGNCTEVNAPGKTDRNYISSIKYDSGFPVIALPRASRELINNNVENPQDQGFLIAMANAGNNINIESPNINDDGFQNAVIQAIKRGIEIKIITSKDFNTGKENLPLQGGDNDKIVKKLIAKIIEEAPGMKNKLQIKWYSKNGLDPVTGESANASHTKFMSIDNKIAIIGSGNMDTQSWNQSREFNILIDNQEATHSIEGAFFKDDWEHSVSVN